MVKALNSPESWSLTKLDEVITRVLSGGTPSTKRSDFWHGSIPWITSKWLNDRLYLTSGEKFISTEAVKKSASNIVPSGNIVFATRVGVGKAALNAIDIAINQDLAGLIVDQKQVHVPFLVYQLRSDEIQRYVEQNKRGATIKGITLDCLRNINIQTPSLPEQQKIAALLLAVQRAVEQQERLIALSSELKKALMHKLFTEGTRGEKQKQTEIGLVPESWEVVPLTSLIADRLQNGAFVKKPVIGKGFLFANVVDMYREIYLDYRQLTRIKVPEVEIDQFFLNEDDLLVVRSSLKREGIGQNCIVKALPERVFYDCHLIRVVPDTDKILPEFLSYFWRSSIGKADLIRRSKTTTMTTINQQSLGSALIPVPQRSEQQEIVEALLSCDAKIMAHRELKDVYSILFRTLLHQLMTAQIRVNDLDLTELDYEPIATGEEEVI